jgi:phosphomannomutase/phosphoglucomutase
MKELDAKLACEVSGHIFFNDRYFGYDDAIYATFRVIELIDKGMDLDSELDKLPKLYSTDELKISTTDEDKFKIIGEIKTILESPSTDFPKILNIIDIDGLRVNFKDGWALVRASNTTPTLVTRFEANSIENLAKYREEMEKVIDIAIDRVKN